MGFKLIQEETLQDIADAIRTKTGYTGAMSPAKMIEEISNFKPEWTVSDLNIEFDKYSPPSNTNRLWVKSSVPDNFEISDNVPVVKSGIKTLDITVPWKSRGMTATNKGNKIYLVGGRSNLNTLTDNITEFDIDTQKFTLIGTLPRVLCNPTCFIYENYLYIFGGLREAFKESYMCYKFNLNTKAFETSWEDEKIALTGGQAHFIDGYFYLVGGQYYRGGSSAIKANYAIYKFDPKTDTYETMSYKLAEAAARCDSVYLNGSIYVIGGGGDTDNYKYIQKVSLEFKTVENLGKILPRYMGYHKAHLIGEKIYIFGGYCYNYYNDTSREIIGNIYEFDPNTNTVIDSGYKIEYTRLNVPIAYGLYDAASIQIDNKIYLFGGITSIDGESESYDNMVSIFASDVSIPYNKMIMYVSSSSNSKSHKIIDASNLSMSIKISNTYLGNSENIGEKLDVYYYAGNTWTLV